MTTSELKSYIDRILGNSVRLLLPSYWWKRAFGAVIDEVESVDTKTNSLSSSVASVRKEFGEEIEKVQQAVQQITPKEYVLYIAYIGAGGFDNPSVDGAFDLMIEHNKSEVAKMIREVDPLTAAVNAKVKINTAYCANSKILTLMIKEGAIASVDNEKVCVHTDVTIGTSDGNSYMYTFYTDGKYDVTSDNRTQGGCIYFRTPYDINGFSFDNSGQSSSINYNFLIKPHITYKVKLGSSPTWLAIDQSKSPAYFEFFDISEADYTLVTKLPRAYYVFSMLYNAPKNADGWWLDLGDKIAPNLEGGSWALSDIHITRMRFFKHAPMRDMSYMFAHSDIEELDIKGISTVGKSSVYRGMMFYNSDIKTLRLGWGFFGAETFTSIDFSYLSRWNDESVRESLVTSSYNRTLEGFPVCTIKLHENTRAVLTEDDIATMNEKGYTVTL